MPRVIVGRALSSSAFLIAELIAKYVYWPFGRLDMQQCALVSLRVATKVYACCRNLEEGETELKGNEKLLLDLICKAYYLPEWCSINDYRAIFEAQGLRVRYFP